MHCTSPAELRTQLRDRTPQQLAHARRGDAELRRDLQVRELLDVVQAEDRDVARLEPVERLLDPVELGAVVGLFVGSSGIRGHERDRAAGLERLALDVGQVREPGLVALERHAELLRDPLIARGLTAVLELADRARNLARELADPARRRMASPGRRRVARTVARAARTLAGRDPRGRPRPSPASRSLVGSWRGGWWWRAGWQLGDVNIVLDRTPMGSFVEVEGPIERIEEVARAAGLDPAAAVRGSYVSLWSDFRARHPGRDLPEDMVFSS